MKLMVTTANVLLASKANTARKVSNSLEQAYLRPVAVVCASQNYPIIVKIHKQNYKYDQILFLNVHTLHYLKTSIPGKVQFFIGLLCSQLRHFSYQLTFQISMTVLTILASTAFVWIESTITSVSVRLATKVATVRQVSILFDTVFISSFICFFNRMNWRGALLIEEFLLFILNFLYTGKVL